RRCNNLSKSSRRLWVGMTMLKTGTGQGAPLSTDQRACSGTVDSNAEEVLVVRVQHWERRRRTASSTRREPERGPMTRPTTRGAGYLGGTQGRRTNQRPGGRIRMYRRIRFTRTSV